MHKVWFYICCNRKKSTTILFIVPIRDQFLNENFSFIQLNQLARGWI